MLKRRASKRFVLAETGEETAWNTTTDNDACGVIPQIDIESAQRAEEGDEEEQPIQILQQQVQQLQEPQPEAVQIKQRLSVPQLAKPGIK